MLKRNISIPLLIIFMLILGGPSVSQKLELNKEWTTNLKSFLESSPTIADINNDDRDEVLVAGQEEMIALDKNGETIWRWKTRQRFMTYPTVLKRKNDSALIFAADNSGQMTCLDGKGKVVWQKDLSAGSEWSASVVVDIDNNATYQVVQTDLTGTVWLFDAHDGKVINQVKLTEGKPVSPAVGDMNGDGKSEIVIATNDGSITVLSNELEKIWQYKIGGSSETWSTSAPVIFAKSNGDVNIIAVSSTGEVYSFDKAGKVLWSYPTKAPVASTVSVGDYDQNGVADIFLITQTGVVYRFDENGSKLWNIDMQGRSLASGTILDINNDKKLEYVFSTQRGNMFVFNNNGDVIFNHQFETRTINNTPSFGNISSSSTLDVVLTGGEAGLTYCLNTPAKSNAIKQWTSYRGNINNTGSWFGLTSSDNLRMIPQNLAWDKVLIGDNIKFTIYNPKPSKSPIRAEAECIDPNGIKYNSIASVYGKEGELLLPVEFVLPGNYNVTWKLINKNDKNLLEETKTVSVQPFSNDRAKVTQAVQKLETTIIEIENTLPLTAKALKSKLSDLKMESSSLYPQQESLPGSNGSEIQQTIDKTKTLNKKADESIKICDVVTDAKSMGGKTSLLPFEGKKWENRKLDTQLPAKVANPLVIEQTAIQGEHSPVSIKLFNITDQLLNVRVIHENVEGIKITPLRSIPTITSLGEKSWDSLPELDESAIISIPTLKTGEVWLDIDLENADAGIHNIEVAFQSLNGAGIVDAPKSPSGIPAPETKVQISLNVLPFNMSPSGEFRLCTWSPNSGPDIEGLLSHGNNVFLIYNGKVEYNTNDEIMSIDYSEMDAVIDQFKDHDIFFLVYGLPKLKEEFGSEKFTKDYKHYLNDLVNHLSEKGIDLNHFALYAVDEPGGHGWNAVNKVIRVGEIAHEVNKNIMIYQDGGGELPMFKAMSKQLDVWVPPFEWLPLDIPEMDVMRNTGKHLWSYNCTYTSARPTGPNIKNINLFYEFRTAALLALRNGATGIGYWVYEAGNENQWSRCKFEYNLVYPGRTKPVTSRRWEAVREGIEDYRIVSALKNYLTKDDLDKNVKDKIKHLINVCLPELVDPPAQAVKYGQSRNVIDNLANEQKMNDFRMKLIECVRDVIE
ncbi:MAG: glycoside hydrolase domain-containing protein [Bacteroidota bacterium]